MREQGDTDPGRYPLEPEQDRGDCEVLKRSDAPAREKGRWGPFLRTLCIQRDGVPWIQLVRVDGIVHHPLDTEKVFVVCCTTRVNESGGLSPNLTLTVRERLRRRQR